MNLLGTQKLESERLILRKIEYSDCKSMFEGWASVEECNRYFPWKTADDIEEYRKRVEAWIANYESGAYFTWLIELRSTGEAVGLINLHEVSEEDRSAETSYILARHHWGKGLMTEALERILKYAFETVGFEKIGAEVFFGNVASEKVLQKCKMLLKKVVQRAYFKEENEITVLCYEISVDRKQTSD